jgi:zinc protease
MSIMKSIRTIITLILGLLVTLPAGAQTNVSGPVPMDPAVRKGQLDNGLTYYIRYNREPEKRASFYFIQNSGAIVENDNQIGLAHFLEHMSMNGTEHFPGKGIISGLEKHGVSFGNNINAFTGFDETVYELTNVPVEMKDLIDTCLLAMYDWSDYISLTDKEIDMERGVIVEEWRQGRDAGSRMMFGKILPVVLKGSKYADRDIIGKPENIENFKYDTLRTFYHDWYRPDMEAIAVVGDLNVDETEKKIKDLFSKLKPVANRKPRPVFGVPNHTDTRFALATDKEAPNTTVSVITLHPSVPNEKKDLQYLRDSYLTDLMNSMINTRITELLQKENPPFVAGSISMQSYIARGYDAFTIAASARMNEEPLALESLYREAERARRFGFTGGELDRAKARMMTNFENTWKQKDKINNDTYAGWMEENFLNGEPLTSPDFDFEFLKKIIDGISVEEVSAKFRQLMTGENCSITVEGLEGNDVKHMSEGEALDIINRVKALQLAPYEDKVTSLSLVPKNIKGSPVIKTVILPQFNAVEWTLANNAKVLYKKADFEKDNVILSSYRLGGTSLFETDMLPSAMMLPAVLSTYGTGDFDNITLQKMLAGKKASASVSLSELTEGINGSSTPKDFETMMQLLYLRFAKPRFDSTAHKAIMTRYTAFIANMAKDPLKIMQDSVSLILTNFNPRTILLNNDMLSKVDFDKVRKVYGDMFSDVSRFTFIIVGNIGEDTVKTMVEKYIGSLRGGTGTWKFIDRNIRPPKGRFVKDIRIPLTVPKATVFVSHSADLKYTPYNNVCLKVISGILDLDYTEKVREEAGGTYGVSVSLTSQLYPYQNATGLIMFDCNPVRADSLKGIIYDEINRLVEKGPGKEDLDKTVSNLLKNREEAKKHNTFWSNAIYNWCYTGINVNDEKNFEAILKKLTVKDVQIFAKSFFSKADVADIVFKPKEQKEK